MSGVEKESSNFVPGVFVGGFGFVLVIALLGWSGERREYDEDYRERCRGQGGYVLRQTITVNGVRTRCIAFPTPIALPIPPEKP